jgi:UDP-N-acetylglucosamine 2-epimerase (non-hydrolysing)
MPNLHKVRVTTILGTRPEIIRLSEITKKFDSTFNHRLIFTSQNRESFVGINFFSELGVTPPDLILSNESNSTAEYLGKLFVEIEKELVSNRPDAVVILGDTNTSLSSIIVRKLGIPIYHLEAGNRSFDSNVPEEVNRKIVDHISDFNLAYSKHAETNLLREGLNPRNSIVIGTPLREVIEHNLPRIEKSLVLKNFNLSPDKYFLISAHRQENIDEPVRLKDLMNSLNAIAEKYELPVLVTTHPRLKSMMRKSEFPHHKLLNFVEPLGFIDYCNLQLNAKVVLSDSGSLSEESAILQFRAITLRDSMERPEALETASIRMTGLKSDRVLQAIEYLDSLPSTNYIPVDYLIENTSDRVINFILSTYHVRDFWSGRR